MCKTFIRGTLAKDKGKGARVGRESREGEGGAQESRENSSAKLVGSACPTQVSPNESCMLQD